MAIRLQKNSSKGDSLAMAIQRERAAAEERRIGGGEAAEPDLTDFMNDWFFGSADRDRRAYDFTGTGAKKKGDEGLTKSSKLTQEWLEEAKKMVASSPSRHGSPSRIMGSPRFVASSQGKEPSAAVVDRRDPLSRSARRQRSSSVSVSSEILERTSARHSRNLSETFLPDRPPPPAAADHRQWFKPATAADASSDSDGADLPPRPRHHARRPSRFQAAEPPLPPRRTFPAPLSPPKTLLESAHRRSVSSSTCSLDEPRRFLSLPSDPADAPPEDDEGLGRINSFLRRQRAMIAKISGEELSAKAKIILSGSSNSTTSSMVAVICYALLLDTGEKGEDGVVVVPVVNMPRGMMRKHKQAAWLFHHIGIDASALLFSDEVDLEGLVMARQLSILVVGQDVLKANSEVGAQCTVLTDNYCEDAYNLLQNPNLKKLLLAGILLDTQNLNNVVKFSTNRDAEAVQLLLVGFSPNFRHDFYEQLMEDHDDPLFLEAMRHNYGKLASEDDTDNRASQESHVSVRKSVSGVRGKPSQENSVLNSEKQRRKPEPAPTPVAASAPTPLRAPEGATRGKNKFFLAKWFGFGSK